MTPYILIFFLVIIVFLIKTAIDLNALISMVRKDQEILSQTNDKDHHYEIIKGLH